MNLKNDVPQDGNSLMSEFISLKKHHNCEKEDKLESDFFAKPVLTEMPGRDSKNNCSPEREHDLQYLMRATKPVLDCNNSFY